MPRPRSPGWREAFVRLQERGRVVFTAALAGQAYARHGTTMETRLTVIDRVPAEDPRRFPPSPGKAADAAELLARVIRLVPPRPALATTPGRPSPAVPCQPRQQPARPQSADHAQPPPRQASVPLRPRRPLSNSPMRPATGRPESAARLTAEPLRRLRAADHAHPRRAAASDQARAIGRHGRGRAAAPALPAAPAAAPAQAGILSDAQLESVIYAGEAHAGHLAGSYTRRRDLRQLAAAPEGAADAVRFRRGWFLGDGTGAGKGRQVAAIILDNWLKGRRRAAVDLQIRQADRGCRARLDGAWRLPLRSCRCPASARAPDRARRRHPVHHLRDAAHAGEADGKASRVQQIVDWLGREFDGVVVFDEAHAMANAAGDKGERGEKKPSQQGQAGLRLQHALPDARILYVSATGATTVQNLAYAARLGLWGTGRFSVRDPRRVRRGDGRGGIAAMEVLARDLKALGLYAARSLSFEGIEYEIVEHALTPEQIRIYDAYADAFQIIHRNLNAALKAANITGADGGTYNRNAKAAARSAFESNKQRFFNHLLTAMKCPTLIARDRARSRRRPCRDRADRLDQRGAAGAPPRRNPDVRNGAISRSTSRRGNIVLDY